MHLAGVCVSFFGLGAIGIAYITLKERRRIDANHPPLGYKYPPVFSRLAAYGWLALGVSAMLVGQWLIWPRT
jgi:hypothetical protein